MTNLQTLKMVAMRVAGSESDNVLVNRELACTCSRTKPVPVVIDVQML